MKRKHFEVVVSVLQRRVPFRVFTVELFDGTRLEVDFPDALRPLRSMAHFVAAGNVSVFFDHESVLRVIDAGARVNG